MPIFINYKDMIGAKLKKTGHVTDHAPFYGWLLVSHSKLGFDTVYLHAKFDYSVFSHS